MRRQLAAWILVLVAPGLPQNAGAQAPDRAIEFEDLGFTEPGESGVRASALRTQAGASGGASALVLNNAGLARVKRIHGAIVVAHESARVNVNYGSGASGRDTDATRLAFAGVAYPIPVLRGSLVPAFTVHRAFASDLAIVYSRDNTEDGRSENFDMEQSGATYAYSLGVGTDLSSTLSMGVSAFALRGSIDTQRQYDWQPLVTSPTEHTFVLENIASDVGGYGAQIGMQFHMDERVQLGIRFNTPTVVNVQSVRTREQTEQIDNDVGTFVREVTEQDTEYILPYRLEGAIVLPFPSLLVTAQVSYADWSNAAVDGRRVLTPQTDTVLQKVFGYSAGVEWSARGLPLRLRAGFEYAPTPLKYLQTDRIDNDRVDRVLAQSGRTRVAAGAGVLLRSRIVLDAAWVRTGGSRESSIMNDEYSATLVSLQGTFWF